jgi:ribosomal protein L7/L12
MRIRIFQAFSSNNSGSYTIVGSFDSPERADEVARILQAVTAEHDAWLENNANAFDKESPLDVFARAHGLTEEQPGRGEDWPEDDAPPRTVAMGHQVLIHVPFTLSMPRLFGEFFYKQGGRVEIELDHAHEDLAVEVAFYVPGGQWNDPEKRRRIEGMERALGPLLPALVERKEYDQRPVVAPVFHDSEWGSRHLSAVFDDLVSGVEAVRQVAKDHGVHLRARIWECPHGVADPLAHLRGCIRPRGAARVIVWTLGADRICGMKALREVTGTELADVKALVAQLPLEVLVHVDGAYAERAAQLLRDAGCDAEAVMVSRKN